MRLVLIDEAGEIHPTDPSVEGYRTEVEMLEVFTACFLLHRQKRSTYGDAFRSQGYMGNVARVLSKASRLKKMVWQDWEIESAEESVHDTLLDLVNLAVFTIINRKERNKWGQ